MIAHSGRTVVTLYRFGEVAMSHTKTKMEEAWTIEEVAFNVPGLSVDCFIPPADLKSGSFSEACELTQDERGKSAMALAAYRVKVAALDKSDDSCADNMIWKMEDPAKVLELSFPIRDRANGGLFLGYLPCLEEGGEALK
ncbi:hypothetical protein OIU84_025229 [Salix udensis]|uniref:Uncharacterized protein n=1 Tax=Salix udensis TaxID=889485 RepID=A0AAD6PDD3_9ROSI|nr:hypothetical protein OIU84_025229 [Salix udensis]